MTRQVGGETVNAKEGLFAMLEPTRWRPATRITTAR